MYMDMDMYTGMDMHMHMHMHKRVRGELVVALQHLERDVTAVTAATRGSRLPRL